MTRTVDLDQHIPALLFALSARISHHAQRTNARPLDLDMCEWRTVQILGRDGPSTINEVADRIAMDRGGTSRALSRLESRGLIQRKLDPNDRRSHKVALTDKGQTLHRKVAAFANQREARLLAGLSAAERQSLTDLLLRVDAAAQEMLAQGGRSKT